MSEAKIESQHSAKTIEAKTLEENAGLTTEEMKMLFIGPTPSKFDLVDLTMSDFLHKRPQAQFFLMKLQSWNRYLEEIPGYQLNKRTEFKTLDFIYKSLKKMMTMFEWEAVKQLDLLSNWYKNRNSKGVSQTFAEERKKQIESKKINEYHEVSKTFKSNPALLENLPLFSIEEYNRPKLAFRSIKKENSQIELSYESKKFKDCLTNNFLTEIQNNQVKKEKKRLSNFSFEGFDNIQEMELQKEMRKLKNSELSRLREKKEILGKEWKYKMNKGRFVSESNKGYLNKTFDRSFRVIKTSQDSRSNAEDQKPLSKAIRLKTSSGLGDKYEHDGKPEIPELCEIGLIGLMENPLELKIKKKRKQKN